MTVRLTEVPQYQPELTPLPRSNRPRSGFTPCGCPAAPGRAAAHSHWPILGCGEHLRHRRLSTTRAERKALQGVVETAERILRADRPSTDHLHNKNRALDFQDPHQPDQPLLRHK